MAPRPGEDDAPLRQQGELLLGDVTRASPGCCTGSSSTGTEQISNAGSVNLTRALRDIAPILKRVLGDDIALLLPKATGRLDVDVDTESRKADSGQRGELCTRRDAAGADASTSGWPP